jgi:hypothetical protein
VLGGYSAIFTLESRFSIETGSVTNNDSLPVLSGRLDGARARASLVPGHRGGPL